MPSLGIMPLQYILYIIPTPKLNLQLQASNNNESLTI